MLYHKANTEVVRLAHKSKTLTFRLRQIDADLAQAIETIDNSTLSDLCRDGLRMVLGIKTTRRVEVTERPIVQHVSLAQKSVTVTSKPVVYVSSKKREEA